MRQTRLRIPLKRDETWPTNNLHPEVAAERPSKGLANRFAVVANMVASDGGKEIVAGNERVLKARLSDAKFFWEQDKKRTLESRVADLKDIVFRDDVVLAPPGQP